MRGFFKIFGRDESECEVIAKNVVTSIEFILS